MKPPKFATWDYEVPIFDHLFEVKTTAEDCIRLGHMKTVDEFYTVLLNSVRIPQTRAWIQNHLQRHPGRDPSVLLYFVLRQWHSAHTECAALDELEALPVTKDVPALNDTFNRLSMKVGDKFLTETGKARLYLKKLPDQVRALGLLDARLDEGRDLSVLQFEALRVSTQPGVAQRSTPVVHPPVSPPFEEPAEPMVLGTYGRGNPRGRGRGGTGRGRGRGGRGGNSAAINENKGNILCHLNHIYKLFFLFLNQNR